jgi:hypothetical protein
MRAGTVPAVHGGESATGTLGTQCVDLTLSGSSHAAEYKCRLSAKAVLQ